jgi:hypothetical protein
MIARRAIQSLIEQPFSFFIARYILVGPAAASWLQAFKEGAGVASSSVFPVVGGVGLAALLSPNQISVEVQDENPGMHETGSAEGRASQVE